MPACGAPGVAPPLGTEQMAGLRRLVHRPALEDRRAMTATLPFEDHFDDPVLDTAVWIPHYLPQGSSRPRSTTLRTPACGCSCPSTTRSGARSTTRRCGSRASSQASSPIRWAAPSERRPVRPGAVVREEQPADSRWTLRYGHLELRARATLTARSMAAWWLVGQEARAERCAELRVMEVFGDTMDTTPAPQWAWARTRSGARGWSRTSPPASPRTTRCRRCSPSSPPEKAVPGSPTSSPSSSSTTSGRPLPADHRGGWNRAR